MTRAGRLQSILLWQEASDCAIAEMGPRPSWWRFLARRRWDRERKDLVDWTAHITRKLFEQG